MSHPNPAEPLSCHSSLDNITACCTLVICSSQVHRITSLGSPAHPVNSPGGPLMHICSNKVGHHCFRQATGLDAWASWVKCPARFVSHLHEICIYIWVVYSLCFFCCLFITVTWWYVWCFEWASGNQEEVQACLVTLWLFIISCYSLYNTTLGLLCSWFENNPHFHKHSMDFHV